MLRTTLASLALFAMVGCSGSASVFGPNDQEQAQMAAYAASAQYPANANPKLDWNVATLVSDNSIRLVNFTDQSIHGVNVWINGTFVHELDLLPAHGSVTISKTRFYDRTGKPLSDLSVSTTKVTLQEGDSVFATLGPALE